MKRPLTGLAVVYAAGIWIGAMTAGPVAVVGWIAAALFVAFILASRTRFSLGVLLALAFATGLFACRLATTELPSNHIARLLEARDQNVTLQGTIVSDTGYRAAEIADLEPAVNRHSFRLELQALKIEDRWQAATGKLLLFVSDARPPELLRYGDVIRCSAILRVPPVARNPGTFDWHRWLTRQGILFTATLRKSDACEVLAVERGNPFVACSLRLREQFEEALRRGLENEPQVAGVLAGMVIGQRSEIPPDTYADFQQTGVFHVFAINGLHVGLVTLMVLIVLRLARIPRQWCALPAIPLLALYVFATGAHPGAVRALVMASVWLLGWMLVRPVDSLNNLAVAALAILIWEPTELLDGGFILSFAVVAAIVLLAPRVEAWLQPRVATDPLLPKQFVPRWRQAAEPVLRWGVRLVSCSIAAWIGLAPLLAISFHLLTPISIVANLIVIPLLSVIIAVGLAATLANAVAPWLTITFNNANFLLLHLMTRAVEWLDRVPFGHQFVRTPPVWLVLAYYAFLFLLLSRKLTWHYKRVAVAGAAALIAVATAFAAWWERSLEVTVLDLRDGVAVFLNLPGERDDWLIDGGGDWSGERVVVPFLRAQGVDRLNTVLLTRGDKAHAAGLMAVTRHLPAARALHSGTGSRSSFFWDWLEACRRQSMTVATVRGGDKLKLGGDGTIHVLHPPAEWTATRSDDNALVLLLEYGATRLLLTSDAGESIEQRLLKTGVDLHAQIVIKGRHGDEPSCTDAFLEAVRPAVVVQSVSTRPSDRYLQPDLRERLSARGIRFYRTDDTGAVTLRLRPDGYTIQTCLASESPLVKE